MNCGWKSLGMLEILKRVLDFQSEQVGPIGVSEVSEKTLGHSDIDDLQP